MKTFFWSSLILFSVFCSFIFFTYDDIKVARNGVLVNMRIEKMPEICIGTKVKPNMVVSYNGESYNKRINNTFCNQHTEGQFISLKHLEGYDTVIFPEETGVSEFIARIVLSLMGFAIIFYYRFRK